LKALGWKIAASVLLSDHLLRMRAPLRYSNPATVCFALSLACACRRPQIVPLSHDAYVWQRGWSPDLADALVALPSEIGGLRVLARERAGALRTGVNVAVDEAALAHSGRPIVAVMRVEGTAPLEDVSIDEVLDIVARWRDRGLPVRGVEIDHDCATAALPGYAVWLSHARARLGGFLLSITALPTWVSSTALPRVLASVDEVVLQLHTIKAPSLFDAAAARDVAGTWSRVSQRPFRVALPSYRARLLDGSVLAADPPAIARFLADLRNCPVPGLAGVVWFRLGHRADPGAWSTGTLAAVIRGSPLPVQIAPRLREAEGGALDVVLENIGSVDGQGPSLVAFSGKIQILEGVRGFVAHDAALIAPTTPHLRAGDAIVIGYVRGAGVHLVDR
jgi:hypothetical protein